MVESLILIAVVVTILWIAAYIYYLRVSDQQEDIAESIDTIDAKLATYEEE